MHVLERYFRDMFEIRATGMAVAETSFYPALANLMNEIGMDLKPKVRCNLQLANQGAGIPDGGLFTANQFSGAADAAPAPGQVPERGAIEAKPVQDDAQKTADSDQVKKYLQRYRRVLVTNFREFILMGANDEGKSVRLESFRLADTEAEFWNQCAHPRKFAEKHAARFLEYLKRVMLHAAPLAAPQDVAWFLASYARDAKALIEHAELDSLNIVRAALEEALGLKFAGEKGEHFFRSTLIQTLFYGVFSAWVLWSRQQKNGKGGRFDWRTASYSLRVPMIRGLFYQVADPAHLQPLGLEEPLDYATAALNRVDRPAFFQSFGEGPAVQYFYEPFLEQFDPELRRELGVWYTPPEIVKYMVSRVDTVLREELKIEDGLADPRVYVLDPCCGTGTYLVEVLRTIERRLREQRGDALVAQDVKRAAIDRVFGFELLPAPFVVAHLQLGMLLQDIGAPLSEKSPERAAVFLTNALTGWEPPEESKQHLMWPEMQEEHDAADQVKRERPILVVLGNPPYDGFADVAVDEERDLTDAYRFTNRAPSPEGPGLNDPYVRFFRMAERRIVEQTGTGIVCYISNYSWLERSSYNGMRERYLDVFDRIWIDCLNGDKYRNGKLTPQGAPDPSIFSTDWNREGIQIGTAVALLLRRPAPTDRPHAPCDSVEFRHLWGKTKRQELALNATGDEPLAYTTLVPVTEMGYPFIPVRIRPGYSEWPSLPDLLPVCFSGIKTSRDPLVVDIDKSRLEERMRAYFDGNVSDDQMRALCPCAMESTDRFLAKQVRSHLIRRGYQPNSIVRYTYRPFDTRWLYWEPETKLLDEKRDKYRPHAFKGNLWIEARQKQPQDNFDRAYITGHVADNFGNGLSSFFPLLLAPDRQMTSDGEAGNRENLSQKATAYLAERNAPAESLFYHIAATLHAGTYRDEHADALRRGWPRIPLPMNIGQLDISVNLGRQVVALYDLESPVPGITRATSGNMRLELRAMGVITRVGGGTLEPDKGHLELTKRWGHCGNGGAVMPGRGCAIERPYDPDEREAIQKGVDSLGLPTDDAFCLLGETTFDVYMNDHAYWKNVPKNVWQYEMSGYQVIKKWLSYREQNVLGRALTQPEALEVTDMARRLAALILLQPELDANYRAAKETAVPLS